MATSLFVFYHSNEKVKELIKIILERRAAGNVLARFALIAGRSATTRRK